MSTKVFKYILDFQGNTKQFSQQVGGMKGLLKGAAVAAGAMFAAGKIMDAAAAVADYAQEISGVRAEVMQLTGAQGAALETMTGQVQAIAQAYDADVKESISASNAIMQAFGDNSQKTFDIINAGFATTANSNEDFLKQVKEYSIHFKEAGLEASQMVAVIAEGNKMGVFDDKAADAIKEGSIRLREMTKGTKDALNAIGLSSAKIQSEISSGNMSMFEVMQLVSRQLNSLPAQAPAVGTALADIFGGPGEDGIQFIRTLGDINTNLDEVVAQGGKAAASQIAWAETLADFHKIGSSVFGETGQLITQVKTIMLGWVNDGIKGLVHLANYFIDLYNESEVFRGGVQLVGFAFETLFNSASLTLKTLLSLFKGTGAVLKAVFTGDFGAVKDIVSNTFDSIADNALDFGQKTADNFKEGIEATLNPREKIELISLTPSEAVEAGKTAAENFVAGFRSSVTAMPAATSSVTNVNVVQSKKQAKKSNFDITPTLNVEAMQKEMPVYQAMVARMNQLQDEMIAKQQAVQGAFEHGFNAIGQSIVQGLGLAEAGFEGFLGTLLQTTVQLISMMLAQSIATSIAGATTSGAATGPGAVIATPVFIATAIAGVLGAFASIPSFEFGGLIPGNSFTGDRMLIRANSGEEVLRRDDPRHSFNQNATLASGTSGGRDRLIFGNMRFKKHEMYMWLEEAGAEIRKRTGGGN